MSFRRETTGTAVQLDATDSSRRRLTATLMLHMAHEAATSR